MSERTMVPKSPKKRIKKEVAPKIILCVKCKTNEAKYKHKKGDKAIDKLCKYCWDRLEYPNLIDKTDAEIQAMYDIKYPPRKASNINAGSLNVKR